MKEGSWERKTVESVGRREEKEKINGRGRERERGGRGRERHYIYHLVSVASEITSATASLTA